ncbi:hypothetical protein [Streptomyces sp. NPDC004014]
MRALPPSRLASAALCAALLVGIAGSAAVATDLAGERTRTARHPAVPGADALLARIKALSDTGSVPAPAAELLERSLREGRLTPGEAHRLGEAAKRAVTEAATGAPAAATAPAAAAPAKPLAAMTPTPPAATPTIAVAPSADAPLSTAASPSMTATPPAATPSTPVRPPAATPSAATPSTPAGAAVPALPALPAVPSGSALGTLTQTLGLPAPAPAPPAAGGSARLAAPGARDTASDALAKLTGAIDALVKAVVSSLDDVLPAATGVVDGLLGLLEPVLPGAGTPTPAPSAALPGLPSVPALPALPAG